MRYLICPTCKLRGVFVPMDAYTSYVCRYCDYESSIADTEATTTLRSLQSTRPRSLKMLIGLSAGAYAYHIQTARALGYVRSELNARGIHYFIAMLSTLTYTDTRPAFMQDTDQWYAGDNLTYYNVKLSPNTVRAYSELAHAHSIGPYKMQARLFSGLQTRIDPLNPLETPGALCSPILEAVGLRWLTPTIPLPQAPHDLWRTPKRKPHPAYQGW